MTKTYSPCPSCLAVNRVDLEQADRRRPVCSRCSTALRLHGAVSDVDVRGLQALVEHTTQPIVVDFWAEWCAPCKAFAPVFRDVASTHLDRFTFAKLDTERDPEAAGRYRIQAIPTLIVFADGRERARSAGAMNKPAFEQWLDSVL